MIRCLRTGLVLLLLLIGAEAIGRGQLAGICPLREVRPGQRALAKSVFRGTKIESFHIEILGVLRKFDGTRSIILGRVLDGPVVTRKSGIIAGMSGSPVYINGRLAGALAYAWSWSKEPIAGITPIEEMLEAWQTPPGPRPVESPSGGSEPRLRLRGQEIGRVVIAPRPEQPDPPGVMTLTPLGGFAQASGFNRRGLARLSELLSPYGMQVTAGPSGGAKGLRPRIEPGAAIGAQLVGGDFEITGLGTVTAVKDKQVLAFGHPLFELGEMDLPMTGGYVHDILPSLVISNKIMSGTAVVGRISRDTQTAVAGEIGERADPLPVSIEVRDLDRGKTRQFRLAVARIRELLPSLTAMAVVTAIDETRGRVARGTARVVTEIEADGWPSLRRDELAYSEGDVALAVTPAVGRPLAAFAENQYGKLRFRRVRIAVETRHERKTATIERATVRQSRIRAGDRVQLEVTVRPFGGKPVEIPVQLALPLDLPQGRVQVVVSGGAEADAARGAIGAPRPAPASLAQLVDRYLTQNRGQELVAQAALPVRGVAVHGEELPHFPAGATQTLRATHPTDLRSVPTVLKTVVPTEWFLSGRQVVQLPVESAVAPAPPVAPPPPAEPEPEGPPEGMPEEEPGADDFGFGGAAMGWEDEESGWERTGAASPLPRPGAQETKGPSNKTAAGKQEVEKPLARPPRAWTHSKLSDYGQAKLNQVTVGANGEIGLGPDQVELARLPADVVWSLAKRGEMVFAGTGSDGVIYRIAGPEKASPFFATGEMSVHALAFDGQGHLWAATSPRGKLFRITPEGAGQVIYDSDCAYLWCLAIAPDGTIYVGAGAPARVYAVAPDGKARVVAALPAAHVLSLVRADSGDLYAGTASGGVVFRITASGSVAAVGQVASAEAGALAIDAQGSVFVASSPAGKIYHVTGDGPIKLYCETAEKTISGLALLPTGELVAATGPNGLLLRVGDDRRPHIVFKPEAGVATALAVSDQEIYLGSAGPATVRRFSNHGHAASGSLESQVLSAAASAPAARWGRVDLAAYTPTGTAVAVETRSGDTPVPGADWSAWAPALAGLIASPPASRLQYRLLLSTTDPQLTPLVRQVRIGYRPANLPPVVALKTPGAGERISAKHTVKWEGSDPDKDTLVYDLTVSRDLGRSWGELARGLTEASYDWDTTPTSDGQVLLRVSASDSQSQPSDPREVQDSAVVWIDNTAPRVLLLRSALTVAEEGQVQVTGVASDATSPLQSIEHRVDDGAWQSLPLAGPDLLVSDFVIRTQPLPPGKHTIAARAFDVAGNRGEDKLEAQVKPREADKGGQAVQTRGGG